MKRRNHLRREGVWSASGLIAAQLFSQIRRPIFASILLASLLAPLSSLVLPTPKAEAAVVPPAFVQRTNFTNDATATTSTIAFGSNNTAGNLIVVAVAYDSTANFSCSDSRGNTYSVATRFFLYNSLTVAVCYAPNIAAGANTVTVTYGASAGFRRAIIHEYSGVQRSNPLDVTSINAGNSTSITSNAAVATQANSLAFAVIDADVGPTTMTPTNGFTQRGKATSTAEITSQDKVLTTAGSVAATGTSSATTIFQAHMVVFRPASDFVQSANVTSDATGASIAQALTSNTVAGNTIVAAASWNGSAPMVCSDSQSNSYLTVTSQYDSTSGRSLGTCYAPVKTTGATTVTVAFGATSTFRRLIVSEYSGLDANSPIDVKSTSIAAGTTTANAVSSGSATTTVNGARIFGAVMDVAGTATIAAGTNFTQRDSVNGKDLATQDYEQLTAGSVASTQTFGTAHRYIAVMIAFKPVNITSWPGTPAFVQATQLGAGPTGTTIAKAFTSNNIAGNSIVAFYTWDTTTYLYGTCTDSRGNVYSQALVNTDTSNLQATAVCYASNITAGANTVTVTFPGSVQSRFIAIHEYSGLLPSGFDKYVGTVGTAPSTAANAVTSGSATSTVNNSLILGAENAYTTSNTITAGTNFTLRNFATSSLAQVATEDRILTTAGSSAATFTFSAAGTPTITAMGIFKPANVAVAPTAPTSLTQKKLDNATTVSTGATTTEAGVSLGATIADGNTSDTVALCVEVEPVGTAFGNTEDSCGTAVPYTGSGVTAVNTRFTLPDATNYHWQARVKDSSGLYSSWVSYGANAESATDFRVQTNTAPNVPSSLAQTKTSTATLSTGDWTNETSVRFTSTLSDTDNPDTVALCVEIDPINTAFSNVENSCGSAIAYSGTGVAATHTIASLVNGTQYHWQARTKDTAGAYSAWLSYGGNADPAGVDVGIDTSAPGTGTVKDGPSAGIDVGFNDGSLSSLSGNWTGFTDSSSGISGYEYSIGTTAGGVDIAGWTSNALATTVTRSSLTLRTSVMYYVNVRATDNAGNVSGVVSSNGQIVAPSLTFTISASSFAFARLNVANGFAPATQSFTVTTSTNAYSGYVVRQFNTGLLTDGSKTIPAYAGTYSVPTTWTGTGFGYTSSDTTIQGSGDIFGSGTKYAGLTISKPGDIVADHTGTVSGTPVSSEAFTLTYKVASSSTQAAGSYSTVIGLGCTAIY